MRPLSKPSLLYIPGSSDKMLGKAAEISSGGVILDLEDSVVPAQKESARNAVVKLLAENALGRRWVAVRINLLGSAFGVDDFLAVAVMEPDLIIIPKERIWPVVKDRGGWAKAGGKLLGMNSIL